MSESLRLYHSAGPTPGTGAQHRFTIPNNRVQLNPVTPTCAYAEFSLSSASGDPLPLNGMAGDSVPLPIPILTAVTGSGTQQSVNIATTSTMIVNGWWLVGANTAHQEVVELAATDVVDATHVMLFMTNNHAAFETMIQLFGVSTKYLDASISSVPGTGLANFGFIQGGPLPPNIFTQYLISGTLGSPVYDEDDCIPWVSGSSFTPSCTTVPLFIPVYSSASLSATGNPTNAVVINAASFTSSLLQFPNVRIQFLFTTFPAPNAANIPLRYYWDIQ